ncbi:hypothetical protein [Brachybacterium paraconglomeratum]|uniref:hypothetical protein n=1 Tax=Brachybacterium paraconglomeratum TaxID=173362 RepID=UPI0022DFE307|nr:hypothetical protein [Brachybacterium paraconglomeratum]
MDLSLALVALALFLFGGALAALAMLCRAGRGRVFRAWVDTHGAGPGRGFAYAETTVLVLLPMCAQTVFVAGGVVGLASVDVLREAMASVLVPAAVILELLIWVVLLLLIGYRSVLPLWIYPAWLRETRRAEVEHLRAQRGRRL